MHSARTVWLPRPRTVRARRGSTGAGVLRPERVPRASTRRAAPPRRDHTSAALRRPDVFGASFLLAALVSVVTLAAGAQTAPDAESWTVTDGDVRVRCRLTVGGAFDAVTTSLSGTLRSSAPDAGSFSGDLRVDLATLDTGIGLRNAHLREDYLEVERGREFRHAVLSDLVLEEPFPAGAGRSRTRFLGALSLRGVRLEVAGEAELRRRDGRVRVEAEFPLSLEAFGVPPPRYLGIGVRDVVEVTVEFDATTGAPPPDAGP